jgi:hypothetical protein
MRPNLTLREIAARCLVCLALAGSFAVPAVAQSPASITIDPSCGAETTGESGEAPYDIFVQGNGFEADQDVELYFAGDRQDDPNQQDVVADSSGGFSATIHPSKRAAGSYEIEALQRHGQGSVSSRATTSFTVPCPEATTTTQPGASATTTTTSVDPGPSPSPSPTKKPGGKNGPGDKNGGRDKGRRRFEPRLALSSDAGPTGSVVEMRGRGFPPNSNILLEWNKGTGSLRVRSDKKGRFHAGMLVFPNDILGPRALVVRGRHFRPLRSRFLVVPSSAGPPDFTNR